MFPCTSAVFASADRRVKLTTSLSVTATLVPPLAHPSAPSTTPSVGSNRRFIKFLSMVVRTLGIQRLQYWSEVPFHGSLNDLAQRRPLGVHCSHGLASSFIMPKILGLNP